MRRGAAALAVLALVAACGGDERVFPVKAAPPSRHADLEATLARAAHAYAFADGAFTEDAGSAPFYGLAWYARRAQAGLADADELARRDAAVVLAETRLAGAPTPEGVMAAFGLVVYVSASGDARPRPALDAFLDRLDAALAAAGDVVPATTPLADRYGPTALTAAAALLEAEAALLLAEPRRIDRVRAIDARLVATALADLADPVSGQTARGYASGPGIAGLSDLPNLLMLLLKARLYRLTGDLAYALEARALYAALRPLQISDVPFRYASVYARPLLGTDAAEVVTLPGAGYTALALLALFEITGEDRFVAAADRALDGIAAMRGDYCTPRCANGLVDPLVAGVLGASFDAGASFQALYAIGYRRMLAGERY